jgi:hypothetical protein
MREWLLGVATAVAGVASPVYSFMCLCTLIDLVVLSARGAVAADELSQSITEYLQAFKGAYGGDEMIPKHHYLLHFPAVLAQLGWLPNCMTLERKHKGVKRWADWTQNTSRIEHGVLRDITVHSLSVLEHGEHLNVEVGLVKARAPPLAVLHWMHDAFGDVGAPFRYSCVARYDEFETCGIGDIVALQTGPLDEWYAHRVWFHGSANGVAFTALGEMDLVGQDPRGRSSEWTESNRSAIADLADIRCVFIHSTAPDGVITLIHPCILR